MNAQVVEKKAGCVAFATQVLGDKWTPLIVAALADGKLRFCELEQKVSPINPRTLSSRLDDLQAFDIVSRKVYADVPVRVEYELTAKGEDLVPILQGMAHWGEKYFA